jgi:hypothetical protein
MDVSPALEANLFLAITRHPVQVYVVTSRVPSRAGSGVTILWIVARVAMWTGLDARPHEDVGLLITTLDIVFRRSVGDLTT